MNLEIVDLVPYCTFHKKKLRKCHFFVFIGHGLFDVSLFFSQKHFNQCIVM